MSLAFTGASDQIAFSSATDLSSPLTIASWFNVNDLANFLSISEVRTVSDGDYRALFFRGDLSGDPVGVRAINQGVNLGDAQSGSTSAAVLTWYHALGDYPSHNSRTAYFNGAGGTAETTNVTTNSPDKLTIFGARTTGILANHAYWNATLDAAEKNSLAKGFNPFRVRPQLLKNYMPLVRETVQRMSFTTTPTVTGTAYSGSEPRRYGF